MRKIVHPAELELLRLIRQRAGAGPRSAIAVGIGDDCALLRPRPGEEIAVTTDLSIDGRHFRIDWHTPESVGHRVLARGLSDLAAMGARPLAAFLSLGLPAGLTVGRNSGSGSKSWADRFYDGLLALAALHQTPLAGGDLAESPVALADIVLVGAVPRNRALLRSGAHPGDALYVTGTLGGAAAGLQALSQLTPAKRTRITALNCPAALAAHLFPQPRLAQGAWLQRHKSATAAIDISDGLSTDLTHLCEESGLAAEIDAACLPIAPGATLAQALHGGEDYELLFTAPASGRLPRRVADVPIARIGRMVRRRKQDPQITLLTGNAPQPLTPRGWQHFV
ncbi:MAG: thiamine-phosphate kinase [Acidobacteriota bacterium]